MKQENFWNKKKVLVLGHTGFKGSWLCVWLRELGAEIVGYGLEPKSDDDNYTLCKLESKIAVDIKGDIRDRAHLEKVFDEHKPEIVLNMINSSTGVELCDTVDGGVKYNMSGIDIYETATTGILNILECIKSAESVKVAVMSLSDSCYINKEQMWGYREDDALGGDDVIGASMACTSMIIDSYRNTYFNPKSILSHKKSLASVRIGHVVGGGNWREESILPCCAKAFLDKDSVVIRNPESIKPWQHVLEPIRGILILAQKMYENPGCYCENWNLGAEYASCLTVLEAVTKFQKEFRKGEILELDEEETSTYDKKGVLDITKAKYRLGWTPKWTIEKTLSYTADWYKNYKNKDVYAICRNHIEKYSLL